MSINDDYEILRNKKDFFIKIAEFSYGGHGVRFYENFEESYSEIIRFIHSTNLDMVVQESLTQCDELAAINESSVNTIRIMTLLKRDGYVKMVSSILRMGMDGSKVDNASSGGITVGIKENGQLKDIAYSNTGKRYECHPNSGIKFSTITIPNFHKVIEMVTRQAEEMPDFRLIS